MGAGVRLCKGSRVPVRRYARRRCRPGCRVRRDELVGGREEHVMAGTSVAEQLDSAAAGFVLRGVPTIGDQIHTTFTDAPPDTNRRLPLPLVHVIGVYQGPVLVPDRDVVQRLRASDRPGFEKDAAPSLDMLASPRRLFAVPRHDVGVAHAGVAVIVEAVLADRDTDQLRNVRGFFCDRRIGVDNERPEPNIGASITGSRSPCPKNQKRPSGVTFGPRLTTPFLHAPDPGTTR